MISLRPYQRESIQQLREGFKNNKRQILCLPTGAGKTVVFSDIIKSAYERGTITLVLTDRIELFTQTLQAISNRSVASQIVNANTSQFYPQIPITLAMVETIKRRAKKWKPNYYSPSLIIIDEAHKASFNSVMDMFPEAKVVGATATPESKFLYKYYQSIVQNIDIPELISQGYLVKCKAYMMQDDLSDIKVVNGEYEDKSLFQHFDKKKLYSGVIDEWYKKCKDTQTLAFGVNISHSESMTQEFNNMGIKAYCITSNTPMSERSQILEAFKNKLFPVLINCGCLTTGFDEKSIRSVIVNRATKSRPLWKQMNGRGSRPDDGKEFFTSLDFGNNNIEHGLWATPIIYELNPPKKKKKEQAAPCKLCPTCSAMLFASAMLCEHCGHVFERPTTELKNGIMVLYESNTPVSANGKKISELSLSELIECQRTKKISSHGVWRIIRTKESRRALKPCPECQTRSRVFMKSECTCRTGATPCSFCEGRCLECKNAGYVSKTGPELENTPHYLREYAEAMDYSKGWIMFERKKIADGEVGFRDETIR